MVGQLELFGLAMLTSNAIAGKLIAKTANRRKLVYYTDIYFYYLAFQTHKFIIAMRFCVNGLTDYVRCVSLQVVVSLRLLFPLQILSH